MQEDEDIRALPAGAFVDGEPPLRLDPGEIARRGNRVRRRRRTLAIVGGSLAVVLVVAAVTVVFTRWDNGPMRPATPPSATTSAPVPVTSGPSAFPEPSPHSGTTALPEAPDRTQHHIPPAPGVSSTQPSWPRDPTETSKAPSDPDGDSVVGPPTGAGLAPPGTP